MKKKSQKNIVRSSNEEDNNGGGVNGQSSSSCCSEDESITSQEMNGGSSPKGSAALNSNGKVRSNRGSATDPQSLYARVRNHFPQPPLIFLFFPFRADWLIFRLLLAEKKREDQREAENPTEPCPKWNKGM